MGNPYDPYYAQQARLNQMVAQQQVQQQGQQGTQPIVQPQQPQISVIGVDNEQQALDSPVDLTGIPQLFTMRDDSAIYAKRFNVKNATVDFTTYKRISGPTSATTPAVATETPDNTALLDVIGKFTTQLNSIQKDIVDVKEALKNVQSTRVGQSANASKPAAERNYGPSTTSSGSGSRPGDDYGDA